MKESLRFAVVIVATLSLAACNGKEDYSDAKLGGPIIDTTLPDPNFDPLDECAPRVVGLLQADETVDGIGYLCGGYLGRVGRDGLQSEIDNHFFVCPLNSKSVTFLLGGFTAYVPLGTGNFRAASSVNADSNGYLSCTYDSDTETYTAGQYDADGPYLFSVSDLQEGPVRVDGVAGGGVDENRAQNLTALLTGLDTDPTDSLITIDEEAHRIIYSNDYTFIDPLTFLDATFSDFVAPASPASNYLAAVDVAGQVGTLPAAEAEAEQSIDEGSGATVAGLYRMDLLIEIYGQYGYYTGSDLYDQVALLGDALPIKLLQRASLYENPSDNSGLPDLVLVNSDAEYFPVVLVDRRARVIGGGAYDVIQFGSDVNSAITRLCGGEPLFLALDGGAALDRRLVLNGFDFFPDGSSGSMSVTGRIIDGRLYSGIAAEEGTTDYDLFYQNVPHVFDETVDRSLFSTNGLCGQSITDQINIGFERQGIVTPSLDQAIMTELFGNGGPAQYTLTYQNRANATDPEPNTNVLDTLAITVHEDGTILTDLNGDANGSYDPSAAAPVVPAGEYLIGMVSSVFPGEDDPLTVEDESITLASANLLVYNLGPLSAKSMPMYGSHFRGRLVPDRTCAGTNSMYEASDAGPDQDLRALWFDPYAITTWFRDPSNASPSDAQQYGAVRTLSYGYVEALRTDCP